MCFFTSVFLHKSLSFFKGGGGVTVKMCPNLNGSKSKRVAYRRQAAFHFNDQHAQDYGSTRSLLYATLACGSLLRLEAATQQSFHWFPSERREPSASVLILRRQETKKKKERIEDGRICKFSHHQKRGRGVSHRVSVKGCLPPPSLSHTHLYSHTHPQATLWMGLFLLTHTGLHAHFSPECTPKRTRTQTAADV